MKKLKIIILLISLLYIFFYKISILAYPLESDSLHMLEQAKKAVKTFVTQEKEETLKDLYGNEIDPENTWGKTTWKKEKFSPKKGIIHVDGYSITYYNQDMSGCMVIHAEELAPYTKAHRWISEREDGICVKMLGPYVMIAADTNKYPCGTLRPTPFGMGIVVDYNGHCDLEGGTEDDIDICLLYGRIVPN